MIVAMRPEPFVSDWREAAKFWLESLKRGFWWALLGGGVWRALLLFKDFKDVWKALSGGELGIVAKMSQIDLASSVFVIVLVAQLRGSYWLYREKPQTLPDRGMPVVSLEYATYECADYRSRVNHRPSLSLVAAGGDVFHIRLAIGNAPAFDVITQINKGESAFLACDGAILDRDWLARQVWEGNGRADGTINFNVSYYDRAFEGRLIKRAGALHITKNKITDLRHSQPYIEKG
jgi:hypothetical protein